MLTYDIRFEKLDNNRYKVINGNVAIDKADAILREISNNDLDMYEGSTNNRLLYQILARIIGSAFFLKYNTGEVTLPKDYTFATLTMDAISEVDITVGIIVIKNRETRVTGVLYR